MFMTKSWPHAGHVNINCDKNENHGVNSLYYNNFSPYNSMVAVSAFDARGPGLDSWSLTFLPTFPSGHGGRQKKRTRVPIFTVFSSDEF